MLDAGLPSTYIMTVNLLLLLSALLSALAGAGPGVRPAQAPIAVAQTTVSVAAARRVSATVMTRPATLPSVVTDVMAIDGRAWQLVPAAPLYLSRRRE